VAEGPQVVSEAIAAGIELDTVLVTASARDRFAPFLVNAPLEVVSERVMDSLAGTRSPQGVVAVVRNPRRELADLLATHPQRILLLIDVSDPGNVGTALRAAEGAGLDAVILCGRSCDPANSKAMRASAGAIFLVPHCAHVSTDKTLEELRGGWRLVGAQPGGRMSLVELATETPTAVAVGSETRGFPASVVFDDTVAIPMRGRLSSLNAGVAAALVAYALAQP
jgi:TrmH family RNA methyltransferase